MNDPTDNRTPADYPLLADISSLLQSAPREALSKARHQVSVASDGDLGYFWAANCHLALGQLEEAEQVILDGLERCRRKGFLLEKLAEIYESKGDVLGWVTAIVGAASAQAARVVDASAFLQVAEAAHGCGDAETGSRAEAIALRLGLRLRADRKNEIRRFVNPQRVEVRAILETLTWPEG